MQANNPASIRSGNPSAMASPVSGGTAPNVTGAVTPSVATGNTGNQPPTHAEIQQAVFALAAHLMNQSNFAYASGFGAGFAPSFVNPVLGPPIFANRLVYSYSAQMPWFPVFAGNQVLSPLPPAPVTVPAVDPILPALSRLAPVNIVPRAPISWEPDTAIVPAVGFAEVPGALQPVLNDLEDDPMLPTMQQLVQAFDQESVRSASSWGTPQTVRYPSPPPSNG